MGSTSDSILTVCGLTKSYGKLVAVNDLSFEVRRGEIFAFLGPNGAGKTTAISMICGLTPRDAGTISVRGYSPDSGPEEFKRSIGLCPQDLIIWESLTCFEQLEFMGQMYDLGPAAARKKANELLHAMGLAEKRDALARTLSGGMKRRLNIALALVHEPDVLILDEPQAGLDPQSRVLVREYIRSLKDRMTVILTTHDMDEADRLADRVAIVDRGKLLVLDTPKNLKSQAGEGDILEITLQEGREEDIDRIKSGLPRNIHSVSYRDGVLSLVGVDLPAVLPGLLAGLERHHLKIGDMSIRKKSLEDVFILLTGRRLRG
jgi:ABC-2 type transport system ATP-binding protein